MYCKKNNKFVKYKATIKTWVQRDKLYSLCCKENNRIRKGSKKSNTI